MPKPPELTFDELPLAGAFLVTAARHEDDRGWFARSWCAEELAEKGLGGVMAQSSISFNRLVGTLRGLHYQIAPHEEAKLVTCVRGAIWDVIVDLRSDSPTYRRWHAEELAGDSPRALYVPEGFAHGFLTLSDDTSVLYQISVVYTPGFARGIRWDDPTIAIQWPAAPKIVSERDRSFEDVGVSASIAGPGLER
jgi:dTDP-4-dehydrorhamnose 3,5-epimerase